MSKEILTRIKQKHDFEVNWLKATNFKPLPGELIVYDAEVDSQGVEFTGIRDSEGKLPNNRSEAIPYPRFKVGDGNTVVSDLPFMQLSDDISRKEGSHIGENSAAFGIDVVASGKASLAQGIETTASGQAAHSEGVSTLAGSFGFRITSIESGCYVVEDPNEQLAIFSIGGQSADFSVITKDNYDLAGKIQQCYVNEPENGFTRIYVNSVVGGELVSNFNPNSSTNTIRFPDYPELGYIQIGNYSHAEGYTTEAQSICSHAEGYNTKALGKYSHVEGRDTIAAYAAHAEGNNTKAIGHSSHSEGNGTTASGMHSHAEGHKSTSSGMYAHAEGLSTVASEEAAHAEGKGAQALNAYAHAEGQGTTAKGNSSHAEGNNTTASGQYAHAEGDSTKADGNSAHAEGGIIVEVDSYDSTKSYGAIGHWSHSEGANTTANADKSHAEGFNTTATGEAAHAEGVDTSAIARGAHAEGLGTRATGIYAHTEGSATQASGNNSHAEGINTIANGEGSHAEGGVIYSDPYDSTKQYGAQGLYSHSEGANTIAKKDKSHAEGFNTLADNEAAHSEGIDTEALGRASHAEGYKAKASAQYSHAEGNETVASNNSAHAEGQITTASGDGSHSEGYRTTASGIGAHAEGYSSSKSASVSSWAKNFSLAAGNYSHVEGNNNIASGNGAHVEGSRNNGSGTSVHVGGENSTASHARAFVHGNYVKSSTDDQVVFGTYNKDNDSALFIVGNGTSDSTTGRKNAIEVLSSGQTNLNGNVEIAGSLVISGELKEVSLENVLTPQNTITLRNGATQGLLTGQYTGIVAKKYDGNTNGMLVFDKDGTAFVGDEGDLQPLATRSLTNSNKVVKWDANNQTLVESNITAHDNGALAIGNTIAEGEASTAIGYETYAYGKGSFAQGHNTAARLMGYYMTGSVEYDGTNHILTLSDTQGEYDNGSIINNSPLDGTIDYAVGDKVTIVNNLTYPRCGTIVAINGNQISINGAGDALGFQGNIYPNGGDSNSIVAEPGTYTYATDPSDPAVGPVQFYFSNLVHSNGITFNTISYTTAIIDSTPFSLIYGNTTVYENGKWVDEKYKTLVFKDQTIISNELLRYTGSVFPDCVIPVPPQFTEASDANKQYFGASVYSLYVDEKPEVGAVPLTEYSHAEGRESQSIGYMSHAEGFKTKAIGKPSYAEGHSTRAIGDISHAEGYATEASGYISHSEGNMSKAIGKHSHAEGDQTEALGKSSHTEGGAIIDAEGVLHKTTTTLDATAAHAEGIGTLAAWLGAHSEGALTQALQAQAHAEGNKTIARAAQSHAEGWSTEAKGIASHAEGKDTVASGDNSHAEGGSIKVGAELKRTTASGQEAHAEGVGTLASGRAAHAEGALTQATGKQSHAQGNATIASGDYSFAGGHSSTAEQACSFAFGEQCHSTKTYAFAFGKYAEANATGAVAFSGTNGDSEKTIASGENSVAIGKNVSALSNNSFALGRNCTAANSADGTPKQNGIAIGYGCTTTGSQCGAIGNTNIADYDWSFAFGWGNTTTAKGQFLIGKWAAPTETTMFAIGNGAKGAPKSIFEVSTAGIASCAGIQVGTGNTLQNGSEPVLVVGENNKVYSAHCSIVGGHACQVGTETEQHNYCVALGYGLKTAATGQTIFGTYNDPDSTAMLQIGNGSATNRKNIFSVNKLGDVVASGSIACTSIKIGDTVLTEEDIKRLLIGSSLPSAEEVSL